MELDKNKDFENVLQNHLIEKSILEWVRKNDLPQNALDQFIDLRVEFIIKELRYILSDIYFEAIDTQEK
jgi:hypothetical protein